MIDERKGLLASSRRRVDRPASWVRVEPALEPVIPAVATWRKVAWYVGTAGLSLIIVTLLMQLWRVDLQVPFWHAGDALLHQLYIKAMLDHGWYLHNDSLGAPFSQDLHDFPLVDSLHFALIKLAALAVGGGFGRATNAYFLMTFSLVSLSALMAMRRLGAAFGPAAIAAQLYAFLPYHFLRGEGHLFLSGYFLIPPIVVAALRLYLDPGTLPGSQGRRLFGVWGALVALLVGSAGAYYAYFSCYLLAIGGLGGTLRRRTPGPLLAAGLGVALIILGALANLLPKFVYDFQHGPNPLSVHRSALESEIHGLRIVQLLLPMPNHRLAPLAAARDRWGNSLPSLHGSYHFSTLGVMASVGFLLLLVRSLRGAGSTRPKVLDGLALLNVFVLILAMSGGFGTFFGVVISPWVRAYERFSIFIAFFALAALALLAGRLAFASRWQRLLAGAALSAVLGLGLLDQTNAAFVPDYESTKLTYESDAEFVRRIEAALPAGAMVFQLPSIAFPEVLDLGRMTCYDPLRLYLHSKRLRWSHGALKGSKPDDWRRLVAGLKLEESVRILALAGFQGIQIDRAGYDDLGSDAEGRLMRLLGAAPFVSRDGRFTFFSLVGYQSRLRATIPEAAWSSIRADVLRPPTLTWGPGFDAEEASHDGPFRWSAGSGEMILTNPYDSPLLTTLSMRCIPGAGKPCELRIASPIWTERWQLSPGGVEIKQSLLLPPGATRLAFACDGPPVAPSKSSGRRLVFLTQNAFLSPDFGADGSHAQTAR